MHEHGSATALPCYLGGVSHEIPLSRPSITDLELRHVTDVLRSGRLSIGPVQEEFENRIAARAGCDYGVAVSSGTAGLHLVLTSLGIGPGDEVITTPFSFIASSNAILYCGATPVFVDIEPKSLNMDPTLVERAITERTKAIMAVETFGCPVHMNAYAQIAARYEIPLIEDCCEALGVTHAGRRAGSIGRAGVFAFYANKQITTAEGGMIVTDDERLADLCRSMRNHGRPAAPDGDLGTWLAHVRLGFNYRMSEVHAAIGVAQMDRFDELRAARDSIARAYMDRLITSPNLIMPTVAPETTMSWFVFVVRLATEYTAEERDRVIKGMRNHDIGCAPYFPCIHLQPFYRERFGFNPGDFPIAESVSHRTIALPFYPDLTDREVGLVAETLELMISRLDLARP